LTLFWNSFTLVTLKQNQVVTFTRIYRLAQNYFLGETGPQINAFLSATAWNMKKMMEILKEKIFFYFSNLFTLVFNWNKFNEKLKMRVC
jgi:IS5 family transposase